MLSGDDLYLRVYHPDRRLAELLAQLAGAEGLTVRGKMSIR